MRVHLVSGGDLAASVALQIITVGLLRQSYLLSRVWQRLGQKLQEALKGICLCQTRDGNGYWEVFYAAYSPGQSSCSLLSMDVQREGTPVHTP